MSTPRKFKIEAAVPVWVNVPPVWVKLPSKFNEKAVAADVILRIPPEMSVFPLMITVPPAGPSWIPAVEVPVL